MTTPGLGSAIGLLALVLAVPAAAQLPGDANNDGRVSAADVSALLRILNGDIPGTLAADSNLDGFILDDDLPATIGRAFGTTPVIGTPTSTATPTSDEDTPTATATATATQTRASTSTATASATATRTATATSTMAATATATSTPTLAGTATSTATGSPAATATSSPPRTFTAIATTTQTATATRTATVSPTVPTGGGDPAESIAGNGTAAANAMSAIPPLVTALVSGFEFGSAALVYDPESAPIGGAAGACPLGGTATRSCTNASTVLFTLGNCALSTASGSLRVNGTVSLSGFGNCPNILPSSTTADVEATFLNASQQVLLITTATLSSAISPQLGGNCTATGATLSQVNGTLESRIPAEARSTLQLTNATVGVDIDTFNANCAPVDFSLTFNGAGVLSQEFGENALSVGGGAAPEDIALTFNNFVLDQNATASPSQIRLDGGLASDCFGGAVTLATEVPLTQTVGEPCPAGGRIKVTSTAGMAKVLYLAGGEVGIDTTLDGVAENEFESCFDPALLLCVGAGESTPTATRTRTATPLSTATRTATATASLTVTPGPPPPTSTATATPFGTSTSTSTRTVTATATRTRTGTPSATPTATTPSLAPERVFCDTLPGPAVIPDNNATGITNTITVAEGVSIADLNVELDIGHSFVGDLVVTLTHVTTGRSIVLVERAGASVENTNGCDNNDIAATFDQQATRFAQSLCSPFSPAIGGAVVPDGELSSFNGESAAGTWQLRITDLAAADTGSLFGWCLEVNSRAPVVRGFECNGQPSCTVALEERFGLTIRFTDPDANANGFVVSARQKQEGGSGQFFNIASGPIDPLLGEGTIEVENNFFSCDTDCVVTRWEFFAVVTEVGGRESPYATLDLTVLGSP